MGISASKRLKTTLSNSSQFTSAVDSAYSRCLSLTQHAFPGVFPYQLPTASDHIHSTLHNHPLILKWVPSPPTRSQIDSALRLTLTSSSNKDDEELVLGSAQFREWALVLFAEAVAGGAGKAVVARVPIGVAGILGVGGVMRAGKEVVGAAIGVYALGVVASVYLGLSG